MQMQVVCAFFRFVLLLLSIRIRPASCKLRLIRRRRRRRRHHHHHHHLRAIGIKIVQVERLRYGQMEKYLFVLSALKLVLRPSCSRKVAACMHAHNFFCVPTTAKNNFGIS